jgi:hypothetical protein
MSRKRPFVIFGLIVLLVAIAAWAGRDALWQWLIALHGGGGGH